MTATARFLLIFALLMAGAPLAAEEGEAPRLALHQQTPAPDSEL